jgi:CRISPR-associated protein Cas6
MYWEEDNKVDTPVIPDDVVDVVFGIDCRCLPVDHAHALWSAVQALLPWFKDEPGAGLHTIHGAASGNGWQRPDDPNALLQLSRRTRFMLRVPKHRLAEVQQLAGNTLDVAGYALTLKEASPRPLSAITTLFARHLAADVDGADEALLLDWVAAQLQAQGIRPRKMLFGTAHAITTPTGTIPVRSLMIADLEIEESVRLQQSGLGPYRHLGCGVFIPHKDINEIKK